jgi:hypothetical protein
MPFIIDGHNLIPTIPGYSLQDIDDELHLVELLQVYCQRSRKKVEVFFDNAPPGQAGVRSFGSVKARFVRQGKPADLAIQERLQQLGGVARNWTVVSSDRQVQAAAHAAHARVMSSEEFAGELQQLVDSKAIEKGDRAPLDTAELDEWLRLFGAEDEQSG